MPIAFINLGASANPDINSATDATSYANTSWTPPTSDLIVAYVYSREAAGNNAISSFTGNGLTWVQIATFQFGGSNIHRLSLYGANASGSSTGVTTVDYGATTQIGCIVSFFQVTGVDLSGGVAAAFVQALTGTGTATSGSVTLAAAGNPDNRPIACFFHAANEATTPGANFTELDDLAGSAPLRGFDTQYRVDAYDTATAASWTTSSLWGGIAAELKATSLAFVDSSHPLLMQTSMRRLSGPPLTPQLPPGPTVVTSTTFNQDLTATATTTATIVKSVGKALTATSTTTASIVKSVGKIVSATVTSTASIVKSVEKVLSATATSTATMVRSVAKTLTATVTSTASIIAEFSAAAIKPLAPLMMTLRRQLGGGPPVIKPLEPGPTVVTSTTFNQDLTATATTSASITKSVGKVLTATATTTASMVRQVGKQITATATSTASIVKSVGKTLTATATSTASIAAVKSAAVLMSATVTTTAAISKSVGKVVSATATTTATMTRSVGKALTATATTTASMVRQVGLTLAATVSSTASIVASFVVTIVPPLAPLMMTLRRQLGGGPPLLKPQEPGPVTAATFQQTLTATVTTTATMVRSVGKVLSATATSTATIAKSVAKTLTATATSTASLLAELPQAAYETVKPLLIRLRLGLIRGYAPTETSPALPSPTRTSQLPAESVILPTDQKARVSQEPVEVLVSPTTGKARLSQEPVEALVSPTSGKARLSQEPVEVIYRVIRETAEVWIIDG